MAKYIWSQRVTLTRTADTNAYLAGDILGAATGSTATLKFDNMGVPGQPIKIIGASILIDDTGLISGEGNYRLHLYDATPPSALGDNAPFDIPAGDRDNYQGYIDLGTPVDLGSTIYKQTEQAKTLKPGLNGSLWTYLETISAYTPTSARVYNIQLEAIAG